MVLRQITEMMVSINNTTGVRFDSFHERLQVQIGRSFDSANFRSSLLVALSFAGEHLVKHWLLDLREIGELDEADETWVYTQFFPQIMMLLGTQNYLAILNSKPCYMRLLQESGRQGLRNYNSFVIQHNFYEPERADAWLNSCGLQAA